jgi:acetylglutamate kinase
MAAQNQKRKSATSIRSTQLLYLIIFVAVLHTSVNLFLGATLSDFGADNHHHRSIDAPLLSKASPMDLAYRQSYGFFNDISDQNWKRLQQGAQRAHTLVEKKHRSMPETRHESPSAWYPNDLWVSP